MIIFKQKKKNGYAVLELLFYISFFVVLSLLVINAMITMARAFRETNMEAELVQSGNIMERMAREIRQASGIGSISSTDLLLNTVSGADTTIEFKLLGTNLQLFENGTLTGNLNPPNIAVTGLSFSQIATTESKAVKIVLNVRSTDNTQNQVQNFYDTIVLRGSY